MLDRTVHYVAHRAEVLSGAKPGEVGLAARWLGIDKLGVGVEWPVNAVIKGLQMSATVILPSGEMRRSA